MVTMATKGPTVTVNRGLAAPIGRPLRTPAAPLRLTRRGRIAVTGLSALLIGALSVGLATAAQATRAGAPGSGATLSGPASPGRYVAKVMVLPGQSLWALAEAYDPNADPRLVIEEIQRMNSMSGYQVKAGTVLWVPRG